MKDICDFINTVDVEDIKPILKRQIDYNWAIAEEGIKGNYGANIGKVLLDMEETMCVSVQKQWQQLVLTPV